METNMQIFENAHFGKIRTLDINGEVWFVGKDICLAFGDTNHNRSLSRVDEADRKTEYISTNGGKQRFTIINESGLYSLLFTMTPRKAHKGVRYEYPLGVEDRVNQLREFKRWVTSEVLPSIRKHGAYITDELLEEIAANKKAAEKLFRDLKAEKKKNRDLKELLDVSEPKCDFYDKVLQAQGLIPMTAISKDYGMSATRMNAMLYAFGVQYKMHSGPWVLYAPYQDLGYTKTITIFPRYDRENPILVMYWTHAGREFLYRFLKERDILPVSETTDNNN